VITIPQQDHSFNISQLVYESVVLSIPMKKVTPNLSEEDLEVLEKFSPKEIEEKEEELDPRWEALKKLRN
jgi:uncharacterized metal-binding protein YceD (DUF177 family)